MLRHSEQRYCVTRSTLHSKTLVNLPNRTYQISAHVALAHWSTGARSYTHGAKQETTQSMAPFAPFEVVVVAVASRHLIMAGEESEKEEEWPVTAPSVSGASLVDAPVLFFVATHKAFRAELASIHRAAAEAAASGAAVCREIVLDLGRRLEFLRLVYNYHSAAEDEVIFLALDALVKNVVPTYTLEHKSIDDKFTSIFHHLDLLMKKDEDAPQMFQELLFSIGTVQAMICQHMHKEEEQVFPSLLQNFTSEEQSKLVWQYMCSVPIILLEEFLPWMTLFLTSEEKQDVLDCVKIILPKERKLQEVVVSWIQHETDNIYGKGCQLLNGLSSFKDIHKLYPPQTSCEREEQIEKMCSVQIGGVEGPFKDKIYYRCPDLLQINGLQRLLFYERQGSAQLRSFVEMLCQELESLVRGLGKNLMFLETEVFPSISKICTTEMQLWLMYTTLHMMPLGLLRCTVTWFSAHLSDNQSNSILNNMKRGCPSVNESFTSLLHEWVRIGCSGKISIDKFRDNLQEAFNGRSFYLVEQNIQNTVSTTSFSDMNLHNIFSQMFKKTPRLQNNNATFLTLESRPMDIVFYIHRALIKDMEYLVSLSAKLVTNFGFLSEFKNRFELLSKLYQLHSDSEDEIAFPALESKGALQNISHSYCIDHKLETVHFRKISLLLNQISEFHDHEASNETRVKHYQLCLKLHETCLSMHKVLSDHIHHEEVEIFPLFRKCFSTEEEEKVVGHMLGMTRAETLQEKIPWLMAYLTSEEQNAVISLWLKVARYTKFDEWLREWWEGTKRYNISAKEEGLRLSPSLAVDPLEVVSRYLSRDGTRAQEVGHDRGTCTEFNFVDFKHSGSCNVDESAFAGEVDKKRSNETDEKCQQCQKLSHDEHPLSMDQEDLEAMIRRVSRDSNLDLQEKSYIMQNLLMSRWTIKQKICHEEASVKIHNGEIPGQGPSYRDPLKFTFGCKHYKRNCKLFAPCCNKLYTCIRCHDDLTDHSVDRKAITEMMCMKCLVIQPIGPQCMSESCNDFSMGRYYCRICKLFDDERQIYHCPYCNLCRVGKGLGIDYFHCMKCNACMSTSLFVHVCREKCLEDNCPICHEYIFTSNSPVKALPCGHLMHSSCFKDYTFSHYVCPICSKSLGDMQVYFGMLDALLAEEKIPEEYADQTQVILCNDCEKRGSASFHWLYHKCPNCGSYNTRLL
ncbi:uncharacterized ring finger protein c2f3.16 [Phtheirospermum japonicum]|uniref:Uncharacterized ring finger protein c2f3.16 n=1 Tax=Phtheirospermum japonicum TaxID=374723 RepID=A0A830CP52_9LAMI|nr:uncharacterized ring finger protein c2f3.16 [Phtheirospermum japonicum]